MAKHGEKNPGFVALDNLEVKTFQRGQDEIDCETLPPSPDSTTPKPCRDGEFQCQDGTCLENNKICNFKADCPDHSDQKYEEENCPRLFQFDECQSMEDCHWEEGVKDELDWTISTIADEVTPNGPHLNFENETYGKFLYIKPSSENVRTGIAEAKSPNYTDSSTNCYFNFYVYLSSINSDDVLYPIFHHLNLEYITRLDRLDNTVLVHDKWSKIEIGIGRHEDTFALGFNLVYETENPYTAGIAVDDVMLFECAVLPPQESCDEGKYHCEISKGCVLQKDRCDYADDCGDNTDEVYGCENYTRIDFEDPDKPFGFFRQDDPTAHFQWSRGNGSTTNEGTGPPFDHTTFGPFGHYLYIASDQHDYNERALLSTPMIRIMSADCHVRFFYHMHGRTVGNLTVMIA